MVPHIVIEDAPSQAPWEAAYTQLPRQDSRWLTTPEVNPSEDEQDNISLETLSVEAEECDQSTDSDTTLESIELESPQDLGFEYDSYPGDLEKEPLLQYNYTPMDEEDEDELPSLDDDFYQSTARRYGIDLHSS